MYNQNQFQSRSDDACIVKVPLPPVGSQAGAGYSVTPGMGTPDLSGVQKATCASNSEKSSPLSTIYKLTLQYDFGSNKTKLTPLSIARALEAKFNSTSDLSIIPNRISKCLTIETNDEEIFHTLLDLQAIDDMPVKIETKNSITKGTFYCEEELDLTKKEEAQLEKQGVVDLYRIKHTNLYAITFDRPQLPTSIKISTLVFSIRIFIPRPRRCFNCQRYGHTNDTCFHPKVCCKCGVLGHSYEQCDNELKCYHCGGQHSTSSSDCPRYILEQLVLEHKVKHVVSFDQARSFIYNSNQNIVSQIPRLSSCHKSTFMPLEDSTTISLAESNFLVQNLNKTIETQQTQIDILKSELQECKSLFNSKSLANETSQMTQTDFHSHTEDMLVCDDHKDVFQEDTNNFYDVSENVIPQPIHQSSPLREYNTASPDLTNHPSYDDEPCVTDDHENNRSLLITHHHIQETTLSEDYEYSYEFSEDCSHLLSNENVIEQIQTHESSPPSKSLSPADMMNYCMHELSQPNPIRPNGEIDTVYTVDFPESIYQEITHHSQRLFYTHKPC